MAVKVAINGFGRIGRLAFRQMFNAPGYEDVYKRQGKSFIPMLIGTGCGVPGIMASRTIENDRDRKMTVMTTTFIPCGAKLPIIALIAGAMFGGAWWVSPSAYFIGIAAIIVSGIMLKMCIRDSPCSRASRSFNRRETAAAVPPTMTAAAASFPNICFRITRSPFCSIRFRLIIILFVPFEKRTVSKKCKRK